MTFYIRNKIKKRSQQLQSVIKITGKNCIDGDWYYNHKPK